MEAPDIDEIPIGIRHDIYEGLHELQKLAYVISASKGFHDRPVEEERSWPMIATRIALIHEEGSEALKEVRQGYIDWPKFTEELADIVIRVADLAETLGLDLGAAVIAKSQKNMARERLHGRTF